MSYTLPSFKVSDADLSWTGIYYILDIEKYNYISTCSESKISYFIFINLFCHILKLIKTYANEGLPHFSENVNDRLMIL